MPKINNTPSIVIKDIIFNRLLERNIIAKVSARLKDPISSINKIIDGGISIDNLHDLIGVRIIVDTEEDCYKSLNILNSLYQCNLKTIKDYIQTPKLNGYQSLHIIVLNLFNNHSVEIQIRTDKMHVTAENGTANHEEYKQKQYDQVIRDTFDNISIKESLSKAFCIHQGFNWTMQEIIVYKKEIKNLCKYLIQ